MVYTSVSHAENYSSFSQFNTTCILFFFFNFYKKVNEWYLPEALDGSFPFPRKTTSFELQRLPWKNTKKREVHFTVLWGEIMFCVCFVLIPLITLYEFIVLYGSISMSTKCTVIFCFYSFIICWQWFYYDRIAKLKEILNLNASHFCTWVYFVQ